MPDDAPLVEFRGVGYHAPGLAAPILAGLSFRVRRGETLVLLGESGCGKTTTLKHVNRLYLPTRGEVLVEDRPTVAWDAVKLRRHTGYVLQEGGLFPHFTVAENIGLLPALENWPAARVSSRVAELLELVGLPQQFAARYPRELSGGQRQRVGVARALALEPPLLLLDEPFGALDPLTRAALQREFATLAARLELTSILVTHDVREALLLGTHIGLMEAGHLILLTTPDEFPRSDEPLARAYCQTL
jgi:osmoprotectant transport system ATP-binding protein